MLTVNDLTNMLALLSRVSFNGIDEAEVGVALKAKLRQELEVLHAPKEELDGDDTPPTD